MTDVAQLAAELADGAPPADGDEAERAEAPAEGGDAADEGSAGGADPPKDPAEVAAAIVKQVRAAGLWLLPPTPHRPTTCGALRASSGAWRAARAPRSPASHDVPRPALPPQCEFYFSDGNLPTDKHLLKQVTKDPEGFGARRLACGRMGARRGPAACVPHGARMRRGQPTGAALPQAPLSPNLRAPHPPTRTRPTQQSPSS